MALTCLMGLLRTLSMYINSFWCLLSICKWFYITKYGPYGSVDQNKCFCFFSKIKVPSIHSSNSRINVASLDPFRVWFLVTTSKYTLM